MKNLIGLRQHMLAYRFQSKVHFHRPIELKPTYRPAKTIPDLQKIYGRGNQLFAICESNLRVLDMKDNTEKCLAINRISLVEGSLVRSETEKLKIRFSKNGFCMIRPKCVDYYYDLDYIETEFVKNHCYIQESHNDISYGPEVNLSIRDVAESPDGTLHAFCLADGTIDIFCQNRILKQIRLPINALDIECHFASDSKSLFVACSNACDNYLIIQYDIESINLMDVWVTPAFAIHPRSADRSTSIAHADGNTIRIGPYISSKIIGDHTSPVRKLIFIDENYLASISRNELCIWDVDVGRCIEVITTKGVDELVVLDA